MHDPFALHREEPQAWPVGDALDRALTAALRPPGLPADFRAGLYRALERAAGQALQERRAELELEHRRTLDALQAGYVAVRRDTLVMVLAVAFTAGAAATVALPWIAQVLDVQASTLAPLLAGVIGLAAGAAAWAKHLGLPRWP